MKKAEKHRSDDEKRVRPIPPTEPAARDEGPRLLPLRNTPTETPMGKYLDLADLALGNREPDPRKPKR